MTKEDLITEAFGYINSFKRHRALVNLKPADKNYNELQMYKMIDALELALRAMKKDYVKTTNEVDSNDND